MIFCPNTEDKRGLHFTFLVNGIMGKILFPIKAYTAKTIYRQVKSATYDKKIMISICITYNVLKKDVVSESGKSFNFF